MIYPSEDNEMVNIRAWNQFLFAWDFAYDDQFKHWLKENYTQLNGPWESADDVDDWWDSPSNTHLGEQFLTYNN